MNDWPHVRMDVRHVVGENVRRFALRPTSLRNSWPREWAWTAYTSGLEVGRRNPTIITLWHAAEALDVPTFKLLEERLSSASETPSRKRATRARNRKA